MLVAMARSRAASAVVAASMQRQRVANSSGLVVSADVSACGSHVCRRALALLSQRVLDGVVGAAVDRVVQQLGHPLALQSSVE